MLERFRSANLKPYICDQGGSKMLVGVVSEGVLQALDLTGCVMVEEP
ncbi:hypothetical protein [Acidilobus sp.]